MAFDKTTTIISMKDAERAKVRETRESKEELEITRDFIRLLDYIHVTSLIKVSETNNKSMLEHISIPTMDQRTPIETSVSFKRHTPIPIFSPDEVDVTTAVSNAMKAVHDTFCVADRLIKMKPICDIVNDPSLLPSERAVHWIQGPNVRSMLRRSLKSSTVNIHHQINVGLT